MFKAIIVDDEEWTRIGLRAQIDWEALDIGLAGEAKNGLQALEKMAELHPDIVVTDISMPQLDGVGLMKVLHRDYPDTIVIVLSGYSDFEYAQQAIAYQAFGYVLKPIEKAALEDCLAKAVSRLRERSEERLEREALRLTEFVLQEHEEETPATRQWDKLGLALPNERTAVIVARIHRFGDGREDGRSLAKRANERLRAEGREAVVFPNGTNPSELIALAGFKAEDAEPPEIGLKRMADTLRSELSRTEGKGISVGVGRIYHGTRSVSESYRQAAEACRQAEWEGTQAAIFHNELRSGDRYALFPADKRNALLLYVENGAPAKAEETVRLFLEDAVRRDVGLPAVSNMLAEVLIGLDKLMDKHGGGSRELRYSGDTLRRISSPSRMLEYVSGLLQQASRHIERGRRSEGRKAVDELLSYIQSHYQEDLSLGAVAEAFHMNPAYLSRLFKQETGRNFNEYASDIRMAKAAELLSDLDLRTDDIAGMVGFDNPKYFYKKFKDRFGCTPAEYRKNEK